MADGRGVKNLPANLPEKSVGKIRFLPVSVWSELNFAKSLKNQYFTKNQLAFEGYADMAESELCFLKWLIIRVLAK